MTQAFYAGLEAGGTIGAATLNCSVGAVSGKCAKAWSGDARIRHPA